MIFGTINGFGWPVWTSRLCEDPVNQSICRHVLDLSTFEKVKYLHKESRLEVREFFVWFKWRLRIILKPRKLYSNLIIVQKSLAWQHSISHWKTGHRPFPTIVTHESLQMHIATLGIALSSSFFFAHKHCSKDVRRSGEQTPWEKMVADFCHEFELCKQIQTPPIWQWSCSSFIEPLQHAHALFSTGHRPVIIPLQLH